MPRPTTQSQPDPTAPAGALLRVFWMAVGNVLLVASTLLILTADGLSLGDVTLWATAGLIVLARYVDVSRGNGTTAEGEPATMDHWRRHAVVILAVAAGLTVFAHVLQRLV